IGFNNVLYSSITNYSNKINEIYVIGNVIPYNVFANVNCDKIIVTETVKKVEANAFTSSTVSEIIFLGDEVELSDNSFYYTPELKKLTIPNLGNSTLNQILGFGVNLDELVLTNITSIPENSFQDTDIKITIKGNSLKEIQSYAFKDYLGETITIPSSVTKIYDNAFENTSANIVWDNPTIEVLTQNTFNGYLGLEVVVPKSIQKITNSAFEGYRGSIDFSQVEELVIGDEAFYRYYGENITIPSIVKEIGYGAFSDYKGSITWDNPTIEVIKTGTFTGYLGNELVIPDSVKTIEEHAISNNSNLLKLTIPFVGTSLDAESNYRFDYIYDNEYVVLDELNITQGTILRKGALENVDALAINLPNSLNTIKEGAFKYSTVQKIIVPNSVTTLEANAFSGCRNLFELGLPFLGTSEEGSLFIDLFGADYSEVVYQYKDGKYVYGMQPQYLEILHINGTKINDYALFGITTIKEINIASTVDYIGLGAFLYCDNLTCVNYHGTIYEWANIEMVSS
ncbi:MAG: leucine-rich repeat protein, partial [Acholeplasmatales bacterium]|nr:leucine-rich repeat protein [Acholeplasmatales bacterium]